MRISAQFLRRWKAQTGSPPDVCITGIPHGVLDRRGFEDLLNAMARAGLVKVIDSSFEKDGRRIEFRKVRLTPEGQEAEAAEHVTIPEEVAAVPSQRKSRKTAKSRAPQREAKASPKREALRAWRTAEAKKKGVPAFRIMSDRVLDGILDSEPSSEAEIADCQRCRSKAGREIRGADPARSR